MNDNAKAYFEGLIVPHWYEIDKIVSSRSILDPNDNIFLGRYVLVKYTNDYVFGQSQKKEFLADPASVPSALQSEWAMWLANYNLDGTIDYDGMVFKKVADNGIIKYTPVAQISTTYEDKTSYTLTWKEF